VYVTQSGSTPSVGARQRPIVPYLRLDGDEKPHLVGSRCRACGQAFVGLRRNCARCTAIDQLEEIRLSDRGEVYVWTIVHQSAPGIPTPYVAAIVDLPEGVSVRANLEGVEPDPANLKFGMPVEMYTEPAMNLRPDGTLAPRVDREGNTIIAYKFRPVK
jgi:uncharacterized OB-fold protein